MGGCSLRSLSGDAKHKDRQEGACHEDENYHDLHSIYVSPTRL